jgi:hypothetical protein
MDSLAIYIAGKIWTAYSSKLLDMEAMSQLFFDLRPTIFPQGQHNAL